MTIETRSVGGNALLVHELVEMPMQFAAGVPVQAAAYSHGEMVAAWERPDVTLQASHEFHLDAVRAGRNEIAKRHLQVRRV